MQRCNKLCVQRVFAVCTTSKFACRQLAKTPGVSFIAVLALALGIGANTAIFSIVNGVLLRPLPFPKQEELVVVTEWSQQVPNMSFSWPNFVDVRDQQQSFSAFGASRSQGFNYSSRDGSEWVSGVMATHDLFTALGTPPLLGRTYNASEDTVGAEKTVVLSEGFWRKRMGARGNVLGEKITLNEDVYTVIGVMPAAFQYPNANAELWVPLGTFAAKYPGRGSHYGIVGVGRLKKGVTFEQSQVDVRGVAERLAQQYPDTNARQSASLQTLNERAFGKIFPALMIVFGAAGCVLLIACANVANLQLARAHARAREFSVRAALGAGRRRIVQQLLIESLLLGGLGCLAGLVLGYAALNGLKAILPANIPRVSEVSLDGGVLLFTVVASLLTSVAFGLVPALHAAKTDLREALSQGARGSSHSKTSWRSVLIVGEFALTSILLICAGLMLRTMDKLPSSATPKAMVIKSPILFLDTEATELRHRGHRGTRLLLFGGSSWERRRPAG
jgi:predicted permease